MEKQKSKKNQNIHMHKMHVMCNILSSVWVKWNYIELYFLYIIGIYVVVNIFQQIWHLYSNRYKHFVNYNIKLILNTLHCTFIYISYKNLYSIYVYIYLIYHLRSILFKQFFKELNGKLVRFTFKSRVILHSNPSRKPVS